MAPDPRRHFVEVEGRQVHYARAGQGPAVALLHGSPQSHRALLPLMRHLSGRFTVFAFDTPGFGASDPLLGRPETLAPFGAALVATLRTLGLGPLPVYGTHTGAGIALEAANCAPDVVTRAVLDGFGVWDAAEQEDMLRDYLHFPHPAWDGSHLAALWSRVRDAAEFFPFSRRGTSARRRVSPTLTGVHRAAMDMLHAGPGFANAYAGSLRHDPAALLVDPGRVRVICRTDDLLIGHLDRLPPGFPRENAQAVDPARWLDAVTDRLAEAAGSGAPSAPESPARLYSGPPASQVHGRIVGAGPGRPLVLLHPNPGAGTTVMALARAVAGRPLFVIDSPGSGLSDGGTDDPGEAADRIRKAVPADADIAGVFTGGALAGLIGAGRRVALIDPPPDDPDPALIDSYPFAAVPSWDGGHLLAAWYRQRDALLHAPWFDRRAETAIPLPPWVDLDTLHARAVETLDEAGPGLCRTLLGLSPRGTARFASGPRLAADLSAWLQH